MEKCCSFVAVRYSVVQIVFFFQRRFNHRFVLLIPEARVLTHQTIFVRMLENVANQWRFYSQNVFACFRLQKKQGHARWTGRWIFDAFQSYLRIYDKSLFYIYQIIYIY